MYQYINPHILHVPGTPASDQSTDILVTTMNGARDTAASSSATPYAQASEVFAIRYGETVSDGVPGPGAGNIEVGGNQDVYTFEGNAGEQAVFDVLSGSAGTFRWDAKAPDGTGLFDGLFTDRSVLLPQTGTYSVAVQGANAATTGTYSFRLLLTPEPEVFAIRFGDTISEGVPAAGAGNVEGPGALDVYTFDATAGQVAIFDRLAGSNVRIGWRLVAPDGTALFDTFIGDRQLALPATGTYTLTVGGNGVDDSGTYSFRLLEVPPIVEEFTINFGGTVADGVPAAGAGNIEVPGSIDRYRFDATAGDVAILDVLAGDTTVVRWSLQAPDGATVFDDFFVDQEVTLTQTGTYSLVVRGLQITDVGTYSFQLLEAPAIVEEFTIGFGDTVSEGVPALGAGNIEVPGSIDRYRFDATAGQVAVLDVLAGDANVFRWSLQAPDGGVVFDQFFVDRQFTLTQAGPHILTVRGLQVTDVGTYSFRLLEAPPNTAPVAVDDAVETDEGVPVTVDVLANDSDVDGDVLLVDTVSQPHNGTAAIGPGGVTYTPAPQFVGVDTFTYTVVDGHGGNADATVTVTVRAVVPPNRPPTIGGVADQVSFEGDAIALAMTAEDPDGDVLTFAAEGLPAGLSIGSASGEITGVIAAGAAADSPYRGEVTVTDPDGQNASTEFQWTVRTTPVWVDVDVVARKIVNDGYGLIPVVIFGDVDVDARRIDVRTVELEGMPVATFFGRHLALRWDINHDGYKDLVVLIDDIAGAIPGGTTTVTVTAQLRDGTQIAGTDEVRVVSGRSRGRHRH
jgi:hypothetical protein